MDSGLLSRSCRKRRPSSYDDGASHGFPQAAAPMGVGVSHPHGGFILGFPWKKPASSPVLPEEGSRGQGPWGQERLRGVEMGSLPSAQRASFPHRWSHSCPTWAANGACGSAPPCCPWWRWLSSSLTSWLSPSSCCSGGSEADTGPQAEGARAPRRWPPL